MEQFLASELMDAAMHESGRASAHQEFFDHFCTVFLLRRATAFNRLNLFVCLAVSDVLRSTRNEFGKKTPVDVGKSLSQSVP